MSPSRFALLIPSTWRSAGESKRRCVHASRSLRVLSAPGAALLLVMLSYWLWVFRFVEGLPASDLTVSREERLREAAELTSPRKVALIGTIVCGLSALLIWLQPTAWWLGLLGIALGVGALFWGFLLRRVAASRSS